MTWPPHFPLGDNVDLPLSLNESVLCAACGATFRVLDLSTRSSGYFQVLERGDRGIDAHVEASCCPRCAPVGRGATFLRPAPTRQQLRAALTTALEKWQASSPKDADLIALMRERLLLP